MALIIWLNCIRKKNFRPRACNPFVTIGSLTCISLKKQAVRKFIYLLFFALLGSNLMMAQDKINKSFTGIDEIKITTISGDCKLIKGTTKTVLVNLVHEYDEDVYQPAVNQDNNMLTIRESFKKNSSGSNPKWTITIPDDVKVSFTTGSGSLDVTNLSVNLKARSGSGDITLTGVKGIVRGTTGSGSIDLENFDGEIDFTTGSGVIDVSSSKGQIQLSSGSGDVRINKSTARFVASAGSGSIRCRAITLNGESKFSSGSGNTDVILATNLSHDIAVSSGSGDALLDFAGNTIAGEVVMKANKKNGEIVAPFEFEKVEEVEKGYDQVVVTKTTVIGNPNVKIVVGTGSGEARLKN